jgi:hypothetical protein
MQGVGSDPSYNPNGGGGGMDMGSLYSGLKNSIGSVVDEQTVQGFKSTGASFWGSLTGGVSSVAQSLSAPGDEGGFDGLADLQRQISSQKPSQSKYAGFGSDTNNGGGGGGFNSMLGYEPGIRMDPCVECSSDQVVVWKAPVLPVRIVMGLRDYRRIGGSVCYTPDEPEGPRLVWPRFGGEHVGFGFSTCSE